MPAVQLRCKTQYLNHELVINNPNPEVLTHFLSETSDLLTEFCEAANVTKAVYRFVFRDSSKVVEPINDLHQLARTCRRAIRSGTLDNTMLFDSAQTAEIYLRCLTEKLGNHTESLYDSHGSYAKAKLRILEEKIDDLCRTTAEQLTKEFT